MSDKPKTWNRHDLNTEVLDTDNIGMSLIVSDVEFQPMAGLYRVMVYMPADDSKSELIQDGKQIALFTSDNPVQVVHFDGTGCKFVPHGTDGKVKISLELIQKRN